MKKIIDKIFKSKVLGIIILTGIVVSLGILLVFNSFKIYEILIGIGLGLLMNVAGRRVYNKPKIKALEIILLSYR